MTNHEKIKSFVLNHYGENLVSLYAYGNEGLLDASAQHYLIVLKSGNVGQFREHAAKKKPVKESVQFNIFTEKEVQNAIDVFPIEFLEMQRTKELLFGQDLLDQVSVQLTNLRHECEYTLRSNILKLRSALLQCKVDLTLLLSDSFPIFFSSFSCIFTLKNQPQPAGQDATLEALSTLTNVSLDAFCEVIKKPKITPTDFQLYIDALSELTFYVNEI